MRCMLKTTWALLSVPSGPLVRIARVPKIMELLMTAVRIISAKSLVFLTRIRPVIAQVVRVVKARRCMAPTRSLRPPAKTLDSRKSWKMSAGSSCICRRKGIVVTTLPKERTKPVPMMAG